VALIQCIACGKEISEKAKKCPHCGVDISTDKEIDITELLCSECGTTFSKELEACPNCGCPVLESELPQKVEITGVDMSNIKRKSKKPLVVISIIVVLIAAIAFISGQAAIEDYGERLSGTSSKMLSGAILAEDAGTLIYNVWHDSIYEEYDSKTYKFTRPKGYYVDFNTALSNLFLDTTFSANIYLIEQNQKDVKQLMKSLSNPPKKYQEAYATIKELYDAYLDLTNLAVDPSGSLSTFTSNFNEADSNFAKCYDTMKLYI